MTKVCGIVYRVIFCKSLHRTPPSQLGFRSTYSNNDSAGVLSAKLILVIKSCPQKSAVISSYCLAASIKVQFTILLYCAWWKSLRLGNWNVYCTLRFSDQKEKQLLCHLQHIVTLNHQTLIGKKLIVSPHGHSSSRIFFGGEVKKSVVFSVNNLALPMEK